MSQWPAWLDVPEAEVPALLTAHHARARELRDRWNGLVNCVGVALRAGGYELAVPPSALPEWLVLFVAAYGVDDVKSAGLSLAMHVLATEGWPLPAGVGFTGAWDANGMLRPVTCIPEKLSAARDGGIFALFACVSDAEIMLVKHECLKQGVALILLQEGLGLGEIVRQVNTACAGLGLTEDRWAFTSALQREQCRFEQSGRNHSRLLPEAVKAEALPVGFVGRGKQLDQLKNWKQTSLHEFRRIGVLEGGMRAGKTTLLAHWLQDTNSWPFYPVWFSCLRGHQRAYRLNEVRYSLAAQIQARFRLLPLPLSDRLAVDLPDDSGWPEAILRICEATNAPIDLVLDGLDEARHNDQEPILELIRSLPGVGVSVVAGQEGTPALVHPQEATRFMLQADHMAACCLVQEFGQLLTNEPETRCFGEMLVSEPGWSDRLAKRAGDNLWILTEFLQAALERTIPTPTGPDDLPVCQTVADYVLQVRDEILEQYPRSEQAKVRDILQTLALLDVGDLGWAISDLIRFTQNAALLHAYVEGGLRRMLAFANGGVRFRDDTFREILAGDALDQDRGRGRSLAVALVDVLAGCESPSPFQSTFATTFAAQFVLEHAPTDTALTSRLLATPWAGRRYYQVAAKGIALGSLLEELSGLLAVAPANMNAPVRELFNVLSQWRPAIEARLVSPERWWPLLGPVRAGRLRDEDPLVRGVHETPVLLSPVEGYQVSFPQNLDLNGVACSIAVGDQERLALASPDGRIFVFTRYGAGFRHERVLAAEKGEVRQLDPLEGWLVLAGSRQPPEWEGAWAVSSLYLLDIETSLPPVLIESPPGMVCVTVLSADNGCARVVVTTKGKAGEEMQLYRFSYLGREAGVHIQLEPEREPVLLEGHAWRLRKFAENTWGVCLSLGGGPSSGDCLAVFRAQPEGIQPLICSRLSEALEGYQVNGICPVFGNRLVAVIAPSQRRNAPEGVYLLLIGEDGRMVDRIRLDSGLIPDEHFAGEFHDSASDMHLLKPLGWHAHHGLILGDSGECYRAINLESEALPRLLPRDVARHIYCPSESGIQLRGSADLAGGRIVLIYDSFALVLEPDSTRVISLRGDAPPDTCCLLGATRDGQVAVCDESWFDHTCSRSAHRYLEPGQVATSGTPVEAGFLNVGPTGTSVYSRGLKLRTSVGSRKLRKLWTAKNLRGLIGGEPLSVKDALYLDEKHWAALVSVRKADDSGTSRRRSNEMFTVVGPVSNKLSWGTVAGCGEFEVGRIDSLANGVVAFRCQDSEETPEAYAQLYLYDLAAEGFLFPPQDQEDEEPRVTYYPPLLDVGSEFVLIPGAILDPGEYGDDRVYAVYQYRVGSLEKPSLVNSLHITRRIAIVDQSASGIDLSELRQVGGRTWVRVLRLGVDAFFGVRLRPDQPPAIDLGRGVVETSGLGRLLAVAYESPPFRVEVRRLPGTAAENSAVVAVGFLAEPPQQVMPVRGPDRVSLAVSTGSGVTWFDLTGIPGCEH